MLKAFTTGVPGSSDCRSSAADVPVITRSLEVSFKGLVASMTGIPATAYPRRTEGPAWHYGMQRVG